MPHFNARFQHKLNETSKTSDHRISPSWWIFPLMRRLSDFFFYMTLLCFFLFMLGSSQKYLDSTLLFLLDLVLKFSYLTLGFGLGQILLSIPFRANLLNSPKILIYQFFIFVIALVLFLLASFVFVILLPMEGPL